MKIFASLTNSHAACLSVGATLTAGVLLALGNIGAARAAIVQTNAFNNTAAGLPVSSTDLLQTDLASVSFTGTFSGFANNSVALLSDGLLGTAGNGGGTSSVAPVNSSTSITFNLNTAANPLGYAITSLSTIASWDAGRDGQEYTVAFSTVGAPTTFTDLFTITLFNPQQVEFNPVTTSVTLTENAGDGILATNVASLRYTFTSFENSGTAYREIDVVGRPVGAVTVPEAGTAGLLAVGGFLAGACALVALRRRPNK